MNTIAFFEIQSSDPTREIGFYTAVFGWKFIEIPGMPVEYYRIETPGIYGGLLKRPAAIPLPAQGTNAFTCSIEVSDFEAAQTSIMAHGGNIALPKFAVPGKCWQGYFTDPDNNTFGIFEVDTRAGL